MQITLCQPRLSAIQIMQQKSVDETEILINLIEREIRYLSVKNKINSILEKKYDFSGLDCDEVLVCKLIIQRKWRSLPEEDFETAIEKGSMFLDLLVRSASSTSISSLGTRLIFAEAFLETISLLNWISCSLEEAREDFVERYQFKKLNQL